MNKNHIIRELKDFVKAMGKALPRLATWNPLKLAHAWVNVLTESVRALPYTIVHVGLVVAVVWAGFEAYEHFSELAWHFKHLQAGEAHVFILR
jgi:hypothetical protein